MVDLIPARRRGRPKAKKDCILPTPETVAKLKRDELTALLTEGELNPDQERAARKIHSFTMALRRGAVPTSPFKFGAMEKQRRAAESAPEKLKEPEAEHLNTVFSPWARDMNKTIVARRPRLTALGLIERVVNENNSPQHLAHQHGVTQTQLLDHLRGALDSYNTYKR